MNVPSQPSSKAWKSSAQLSRRPLGCFILTFLLGMVIGISALLLVVVMASGPDRQAIVTPPAPTNDAIVVQLKKTYLSQIIQKNIPSAGLPGQVKNIQVTMVRGNAITLSGDDQMSVLGFTTTKRFTLTLQPVVRTCKVEVRVLRADLQGIPVTNVAASVETQINQQLQQMNLTNLPSGFIYCASGVRTEPEAMIVTYSATPQ